MECLDNFFNPDPERPKIFIDSGTPRIEFSYEKIFKRSQRIASFCKENQIELFLAVKSCSEEELLKIISKFVDGFDCSNINEYEAIKKYNKKISFYNPIANQEFLDKIKNISCDVVLENPSDTKFNGMKIVRINPTLEFNNKTSSRFGISLNQISGHNDIDGIHFHVRELHEYNAGDFIEIINKCLANFPNIKFVNLGGGWHKLEKNLQNFNILSQIRKTFPDLLLRIEPGRYFTLDCGKIIGKVHKIDIEKKTVITNISSFLHLNWCEPKIKISHYEEDSVDIQLVGPSCFEFDILGNFTVPIGWWKNLKAGNEIILEGLSSYTIQRQSEFNGISKAKVSVSQLDFANMDIDL